MSFFKKGHQPILIKSITPPKAGSCLYIPPAPASRVHSYCDFCGKQVTCKYKAKFERLKQELAPIKIECKYYEEWSGYSNVK